jgi:murein tripeptide amidase MpaA
MLVDVHGDEELPYCFIAGSEGIPGWNDRLKGLQDAFCAAYKRASPDFQTKFGYEVEAPGKANMTVCSNQVRGAAREAMTVHVLAAVGQSVLISMV